MDNRFYSDKNRILMLTMMHPEML